jgi:hypothetical protein
MKNPGNLKGLLGFCFGAGINRNNIKDLVCRFKSYRNRIWNRSRARNLADGRKLSRHRYFIAFDRRNALLAPSEATAPVSDTSLMSPSFETGSSLRRRGLQTLDRVRSCFGSERRGPPGSSGPAWRYPAWWPIAALGKALDGGDHQLANRVVALGTKNSDNTPWLMESVKAMTSDPARSRWPRQLRRGYLADGPR